MNRYSTNSFAGSTVEAAGWGTIEYGGPKSNKLLKVALSVISNAECSSKLGDIIPTKICTYTSGKDTCQVSLFNFFCFLNLNKSKLYY